MMDHDIREAVLHLDPLRSVVKTELIQRDGTCIVKHIPGDALADELKAHTHIAPMHTGLLPPGVAMLTAYPDVWDVTLETVTDRCTVYYHKTVYPDFPLPHLLLRCKVKHGALNGFHLAVAEIGSLTPDTKLYQCPFPNVSGFSLCVGTNQFTGYDTLWKLRGLMHRVLSLPFGDDYYQPGCTRLGLSARDLFERLKDKEPAYYYSDVLIPIGKTLTDFIGGV